MRDVMNFVARFMAILGGVVLTAMVLLTCISVLGRGLNTFGHSDLLESWWPAFGSWLISTGVGPVGGDIELVQAGMAFSIFAFLPLCQLRREHATVDIFTNKLPDHLTKWLVVFWEVVLAVVIVVIAWRLFAGMLVKYDNGQTTFLLQFPVWWAYGASCIAAGIAGLVGFYCALDQIIGQVTGAKVSVDTQRTKP